MWLCNIAYLCNGCRKVQAHTLYIEGMFSSPQSGSLSWYFRRPHSEISSLYHRIASSPIQLNICIRFKTHTLFNMTDGFRGDSFMWWVYDTDMQISTVTLQWAQICIWILLAHQCGLAFLKCVFLGFFIYMQHDKPCQTGTVWNHIKTIALYGCHYSVYAYSWCKRCDFIQ